MLWLEIYSSDSLEINNENNLRDPLEQELCDIFLWLLERWNLKCLFPNLIFRLRDVENGLSSNMPCFQFKLLGWSSSKFSALGRPSSGGVLRSLAPLFARSKFALPAQPKLLQDQILFLIVEKLKNIFTSNTDEDGDC